MSCETKTRKLTEVGLREITENVDLDEDSEIDNSEVESLYSTDSEVEIDELLLETLTERQ